MGSSVVKEEERVCKPVDWGTTKNLFGPVNGGAQYLQVGITEFAPGAEHGLHRHPDQEEVIYVLDGEGISRSDEGDKPIRAGDFVFIPANAEHATINTRKDKPLKNLTIKSPPTKSPPTKK